MRNDLSKRLKQIVLGIAVLLLAGGIACKSTQQNLNSNTSGNENANANSNTSATGGAITAVESALITKTSTFDHNREEHRVGPDAKIKDCAACHKRDTQVPSDVQVKQPGKDTWTPYHDSCDICHNKESFRQTSADTLKEQPLCAGCHKAEGGQIVRSEGNVLKGVLINYPARLFEFGLKGGTKGFSHKTHMDAQKMAGEGKEVSCNTCHKFDGRGAQASFPKHADCFSCHSHQAGQKFGECGVCHTGTAVAVKYSPGIGTALNLYNFRHSSSHLKSACDRCHKTQDPASETSVDIQQINTARGQRHKSSCWSCHQQARENVCTKCHVGSLPF
ncbi:MAG: cytochrome c family protein [Blastocatellia bacterium]|nr:cytochrome c family protein [Blastocatellia bacterium]